MDIEGKCAFITGGTSGMGLQLAKKLLKSRAANVIIAGRNEPEGRNVTSLLEEQYGLHKIQFINMNVNDPYEFEGAFKYIKDNYEGLDIFFNNADTIDEKDIINTNLVSKIQGILMARVNMKDGGVIVNSTSALGLNVNGDMITYSAASAGIIAASTAFSNEIYNTSANIRMMTLCMEPLNQLPAVQKQKPYMIKPVEHCISDGAILMAKAAIYLVEYAPSNTIWLCEQNKVLYKVELQQLNEFSIKFEPKFQKDADLNPKVK